MLGLFKDNPVMGKASTIIQSPNDKLFNFIGIDLLVNYPRWSPEVKDLEKLTNKQILHEITGISCMQMLIDDLLTYAQVNANQTFTEVDCERLLSNNHRSSSANVMR